MKYRNKILLLLLLNLLLITGCTVQRSEHITFSRDQRRYSWSTRDFGLPTDWSEYNYLVPEIKASSPQRFYLGLYTDHGYTEISVLPFQNTRITLPIPLRFYRKPNTEGSEMAALYSRSLETGWFNIWGVKTGPLDRVDSIILRMDMPLGDPSMEIYGFTLTEKRVQGRALEPEVLVDRFGQWIPGDDSGKIENEEQLKARWAADDALVAAQSRVLKRDIYGGLPEKVSRATGFFRTEKIDGKWWFVDPLGHLFLATGINGVSPGDYTRTGNREYIFAEMPPEEFVRKDKGKISYISPGLWNQYRHYGKGWKKKWKAGTIRKMRAWGFNAINWSVPWLNDSVVYAKFLYGWGIEEGVMGFPDVYSEEFVKKADEVAAQQCAPLKDDPRMLGYFLGNEPVFPGQELLVAEAFLKGPDTRTKEKLKRYLALGDTPERRIAFVHNAYRRFLKIVVNAVRKYDTNHLVLGMRYGNLDISDDVIRMAKIFDVFSFNRYTYTLPREKLDHIDSLLDMPILVGEFHFGVPGRGLAEGLAQVADQHERGVAYRNYVENAFAHPAVVATFWYRWRDQPVTGRDDGENYNIGMVDVTDLIYRELVGAVIETHQRVYDIHKGVLPPFSQLPKGNFLEK